MLSKGNTSDVYAIGVDAVVKVPRPDVPDHWIEIEARHAAAVHDAGLPAPMVLDILDVDGRRSIVFERVVGPSMLEQLATAPETAEALAREMAAIQREFLAADAPAELPSKRERITGKIADATPVTADDRTEAARLLGELPMGRAVCHGDFHPGNILLGRDGPMVIDWFDAASGLPLADIVRSSLLVRPLRSTPGVPPHLSGVPVEVLARFHRTYVSAMLDGTDHAVRSVLTWEAVLAISRLSEPLEVEVDDLIAVWRARADRSLEPSTPLAEVVVPMLASEQ